MDYNLHGIKRGLLISECSSTESNLIHINATMKTKENNNDECPFWSPADKTCKVQSTGLFIPLDDHIEVYCKRAEHTLCQQYKLSERIAQNSEKTIKGSENKNRRQHPRIKSNYPLTLVRLNESGNVVDQSPSRATIVDLSSGGMRLTTREMLMHDSIIQFHFSTSSPSSMKSGLAKVKWCLPTNDDLQYQAGLAFQNELLLPKTGNFSAIQM
jgi:hypothetical protein